MNSSRLKVIIVLLLTCCSLASIAHAADKRPNIVIIMTDDMGFSDIGCYGGETVTGKSIFLLFSEVNNY